VPAEGGSTVRLVDYASAGADGSRYATWLPLAGVPAATPFSRATPLRSRRVK
jgi:hypothetical protein